MKTFYAVSSYDKYGIVFTKQYKTLKSAEKKFDTLKSQVSTGKVTGIALDVTRTVIQTKWGVVIEKRITTQYKSFSNASYTSFR